MKVTLGKDGLTKTQQGDFAEQVQCVHCGGTAKIAFVAHESLDEDDQCKFDGEAITDLSDGKEMWVHDYCSVANYFCIDCLKVTAIMNQA